MRTIHDKFAVLAAVCALLLPSIANSHYITGSENVVGTRNTAQYTSGTDTYGPFGWNFSYTRSFDGTALTKHLEIDFMFDLGLGYTNLQKQAYRDAAEANIEGIWNNKFKIVDTSNNMMFALAVDVTTNGPAFNQTVTVKQAQGLGDEPYNMTHWYVGQDTAASHAHEFGHMLGLFDEYVGGAVNQFPNPLLSNDGLMGLGALNANPVMYERYYQQYLDYMKVLNPETDHAFRLSQVPESGGLFYAGILALALFRWRSSWLHGEA
jgi:hypothetical protein